MSNPIQTAADCPRCGFGTDAMSSGVCPLCQNEKQSLLRYGLSNSISAIDVAGQAEHTANKILVVVAVSVVVLFASFFLIVRQANHHLDQAVARIERASR